MGVLQMVLYILFFAIVTAVLYVWGLKKTINESSDLNRILVAKCSKKILNHLAKNESITESEIIRLIDGTKADLFWSKNKIKITDAKKFSKEIINFMLENKYIIKNGNKYSLNKCSEEKWNGNFR